MQTRDERVLVADRRDGGIDPQPSRRHDGEGLERDCPRASVPSRPRTRRPPDGSTRLPVNWATSAAVVSEPSAARGSSTREHPDAVAQRLARGVVVEGRRERVGLDVGAQPEQLRVLRRLAHPGHELPHPGRVACADRGSVASNQPVGPSLGVRAELGRPFEGPRRLGVGAAAAALQRAGLELRLPRPRPVRRRSPRGARPGGRGSRRAGRPRPGAPLAARWSTLRGRPRPAARGGGTGRRPSTVTSPASSAGRQSSAGTWAVATRRTAPSPVSATAASSSARRVAAGSSTRLFP